jgi:hypothetical protein
MLVLGHRCLGVGYHKYSPFSLLVSDEARCYNQKVGNGALEYTRKFLDSVEERLSMLCCLLLNDRNFE